MYQSPVQITIQCTTGAQKTIRHTYKSLRRKPRDTRKSGVVYPKRFDAQFS
jgi:hypothetical protein